MHLRGGKVVSAVIDADPTLPPKKALYRMVAWTQGGFEFVPQEGEPTPFPVEIAESTVMNDVDTVATQLAELKQLGVRIAIEDFGSAYAHHSDLRRLPLDFLNVDRGSLASSDDEDYRSWLLQAILVL